MRIKIRHLVYFIWTVFPLVGCVNGFEPVSGVVKQLDIGSTCKISTAKAAVSAPSFYSENKLHSEEWFSATAGDVSPASQKVVSEKIFKQGEEVSVLINVACVEQQGLPEELSLKKNLRKTKSQVSSEQTYVARVSQDMPWSELNTAVNESPCILGLSPAKKLYTQALPTDTLVAQQRHIASIGLTSQSFDYFNNSTRGIRNDIVVAVIDNGVDLAHIELKNRLWINTAELNGQAGVDDDGNGYIDDINGYDFASDEGDPSPKAETSTHGTHVAGLIAAENNRVGVIGVMSSKAKIMALNVFGASDGAEGASIDEAIRYAADNGAKVINMSLGGPGKLASTAEAMRYAVNKGVFIVMAAGNDGLELSDTNFVTPASYSAQIEGAVSVAASDVKDPTKLCSFSNYSSSVVEIAAPGCDTARTDLGLLSTIPDDKAAYYPGTSMASPIVAGSAALMIAYLRDRSGTVLTPAQAEDFLRNASPTKADFTASVVGGKQLNLLNSTQFITQSYANGTLICL